MSCMLFKVYLYTYVNDYIYIYIIFITFIIITEIVRVLQNLSKTNMYVGFF
jgi:hypothetical protein